MASASTSRELRLSALLAELRADAERRTTGARSSSAVVDASDGLTVGEILDATAHAGFGFVAAFLALIAIPFVGLSTPFGLAVAFVGAQIVAGRQRPWLPARIRRRVVSLGALDLITRWLARMTRWMAHLVRPRWPRLTTPLGFQVLGVALIIQGLGLALPIPLPGSNMIFLVPILIYGIGVLDDDGVLVALGHVATAVNIGVIVVLWRGVAAAISHGLAWLHALV